MAKRKRFSETERSFIVRRAQAYCEYCKTFVPDTFEIEHIIPLIQNGTDDLDNLALSCGGCNSRKSSKTSAIDPLTGIEEPLFHPRNDIWQEHFEWTDSYTRLIGLSSIGRATIEVLQLNRSGLISLRRMLFRHDNYPPM